MKWGLTITQISIVVLNNMEFELYLQYLLITSLLWSSPLMRSRRIEVSLFLYNSMTYWLKTGWYLPELAACRYKIWNVKVGRLMLFYNITKTFILYHFTLHGFFHILSRSSRQSRAQMAFPVFISVLNLIKLKSAYVCFNVLISETSGRN